MKTTEEWRAQLDLPNIREVVHLPWERWIKAIQLDAERSGFERGLKRSIEICRSRETESDLTIEAMRCRQKIEALLTKKEEKDK